jgi:coenzyme F420-0:L-glutamate ligase/coenzyme F420-1:gamma-L-glutamate ligase
MNDYDQLLALIRSRRSIRRFSDRTVSHDDLMRLLEAARWAPSNHNRQPWNFLIIEDRQQLRQLAEAVRQDLTERMKSLPEAAGAYLNEFIDYTTFFAAAPALVMALHKRPVSVSAPLLAGVRNPELVSGEPLSVAMAVQNLLLAAQALGLGACVLTGPLLVPEAVTRALALPPGHDLTCLVAVGHPAESPPPPRRKTIEQIAEFGNNPRRPESGNDRKGNC